jgi:hypothetical protein
MVNRRSASESAMISFMVWAPNATCSLLIRPLARRIDSQCSRDSCTRPNPGCESVKTYCLSYTLVTEYGFPSAPVPLVVTVATFPSFDTVASAFATSLPPFFSTPVV